MHFAKPTNQFVAFVLMDSDNSLVLESDKIYVALETSQ